MNSKDYPESALYMIGTIDEAKAKDKATPANSPDYTQAQPLENRDRKRRWIAGQARVAGTSRIP